MNLFNQSFLLKILWFWGGNTQKLHLSMLIHADPYFSRRESNSLRDKGAVPKMASKSRNKWNGGNGDPQTWALLNGLLVQFFLLDVFSFEFEVCVQILEHLFVDEFYWWNLATVGMSLSLSQKVSYLPSWKSISSKSINKNRKLLSSRGPYKILSKPRGQSPLRLYLGWQIPQSLLHRELTCPLGSGHFKRKGSPSNHSFSKTWRFSGVYLGCGPPPSNSDHQDYYIFNKESL